jgi:hypothetical protein
MIKCCLPSLTHTLTHQSLFMPPSGTSLPCCDQEVEASVASK